MAERRMIAKSIIDSDAFLEMPISAQCLYFHLNMRADDDGFVGNPRSIMRYVKASDDDIKLLIAKRFVLIFESGVIVIKHWRINNYIRNDRYKETNYKDEKALLGFDENNAYTEKSNVGIPLDNQMVDSWDTQDRLGKDSIDKDSIGKVNKEKNIKKENAKFEKPTLEEVTKYVIENEKNVNPDMFFNYYETNGWKVGKNPMKSWKSAIALWACKANESNIDYVSKRKQEQPSNELTKVDQELLDLLGGETEEETSIPTLEELEKLLKEKNIELEEYNSVYDYALSNGTHWKSALEFVYGVKL